MPHALVITVVRVVYHRTARLQPLNQEKRRVYQPSQQRTDVWTTCTLNYHFVFTDPKVFRDVLVELIALQK